MADTKNLLLRLDPALAARLEAVAEVEGQSVSDVVREAIADHIRRRQRDPKFNRLLKDSLARHRRLLRLLAEGEPE
jgi:predicted transcriptional regulator